jgi:signal transduction histidine kinase
MTRHAWKMSFVLMAAVMVVYTILQLPIMLYRASDAHGVPWNDFVFVLIGTFFVTLNVPLSAIFAGAIRLGRRRWLMLGGWVLAMLALQVVALWAQIMVQRAFWPAAYALSMSLLFPVAIVLDSATAAGLLFGVIAIQNHDAARRAAIRADQLRALARDEELNALLAQLHPHFLFNTLNAIAALIRTDPVTAKITIAQLRLLIEQHIDSAPAIWTVADEMHVVRTYLDIEKRRFGDRLQIVFDIDPQARGAAFPRLLLQPLVENAVRHGTRGGGRVSVTVNRDADELQATVRDTGLFRKSTSGGGVGLKNVRARLELLYGQRHRFDIATGESGTVVTVALPASA